MSGLLEIVKSFRGVMGVAAIDLLSAESRLVDADRPFPAASLIKTAIMLEVFHQLEEGRLHRDMVVPLTEEAKTDEPTVLEHLHAGLPLTVEDLVKLMIVVSDNTATNLLLARIGTESVNRRLHLCGLSRTRLHRPVGRDGHADVDPEAEREFGLAVTTPREMARLFDQIARGQAASRQACDAMLAILRAQHDRAMIPRGLPCDAALRVANKTGEDLERQPDAQGRRLYVRGDVAFVAGPDTSYVLAILTRHGEDTRPSVDNAALVAGASVARWIHGSFTRRA